MKMRNNGFTLIELMITVAVVALLAAVAYPSYRNQIMRSNRTEAKIALMSAAQSLEKCYTTASTYVGCGALTTIIGKTPNGRYTISAGAANVDIKAREYLLTATPAGSQADDSDCATLTISHTGERDAKDKSSADTREKCWR
jgi:type IV pilus assembly protein PilE